MGREGGREDLRTSGFGTKSFVLFRDLESFYYLWIGVEGLKIMED